MNKVSDTITTYQLRGMILPINPVSKTPVFLELNKEFYLPLFTAKEKFEDASKWGGFQFATASIILNPLDFRSSVFGFRERFPFHVIVDPYITGDGKTQFQLVQLEEEKNGQES